MQPPVQTSVGHRLIRPANLAGVEIEREHRVGCALHGLGVAVAGSDIGDRASFRVDRGGRPDPAAGGSPQLHSVFVRRARGFGSSTIEYDFHNTLPVFASSDVTLPRNVQTCVLRPAAPVPPRQTRSRRHVQTAFMETLEIQLRWRYRMVVDLALPDLAARRGVNRVGGCTRRPRSTRRRPDVPVASLSFKNQRRQRSGCPPGRGRLQYVQPLLASSAYTSPLSLPTNTRPPATAG